MVDGKTGLLILPEDSDALADALGQLLSDSNRSADMGREGRARFESEFEFEPFYQRVINLYEVIVSARKM